MRHSPVMSLSPRGRGDDRGAHAAETVVGRVPGAAPPTSQQAPSAAQSAPEPGLTTQISRVVATAYGEPQIAWLVWMASRQPRRVLLRHDNVHPSVNYLRLGGPW
jgi:hypothetical protein